MVRMRISTLMGYRDKGPSEELIAGVGGQWKGQHDGSSLHVALPILSIRSASSKGGEKLSTLMGNISSFQVHTETPYES